MMKKSILFAIVCACPIALIHAQVATQTTTLRKAAQEFRTVENNNYAKALQLAKEKGWPLTVTGKNNTVATLMGVDAFGLPKYYVTTNNIIAAATTRASQLWPGGSTGLNLNGSSANIKNKVAVWDGGSALSTHVELAGRITVKDGAAVSDHSTHVSGTIIATGLNPVAKGMAYGTQGLLSYNYTNDLSEMFGESPNIVLSNHSYGVLTGWVFNTAQNRWEFYGRPNATEDYKFGYYSNDAQVLDSIAYNAPFYLIVKAAGNSRDVNGPAVGQPYFRLDNSGTMVASGNRPDGISNNDSYGIISWDANAKNILTVGAVSGLPAGYSKAQDVIMSSFSCWGPTDDGRIKPDVVADGINVTSTIGTTNTSYATYSGTSMATPNATGSLLLLQEYYSKLKAGAFLRSATLKGLAIHTADEAGVNPGPDYQFGWGLLNVQKAAAVITAAVPSNNAATSNHLLFENTLNNGQTFTTTVVASGNGPFMATLCWTDVKGDVDAVNTLNNPVRKLVNDLDIRITKGATTYMPWILNPAAPSLAATHGDNVLDNVEKIDVDDMIPGQAYIITITHKGTLARGSQAYSLLVSGVGGQAYCSSGASTAAGSRIDSVSFGGIQKVNPAGCTTYPNYTNLVGSIEPNQTLPIVVKVGTCDVSTDKIVKVFIDYNNNGVFTDPGEMVAQSNVINGNGTFTGNVVTPASLVPGTSTVMRVIVQETTNAAAITPCGAFGNGETQDFLVRVINPSTDIAIADLSVPLSNSCSSASQLVTIAVQNRSAADKSNIPLTAIVKNGAATVATLTAVYPGAISANALVSYTFQTPFNSVAGTTYTISAFASFTGDQNKSNDTVTSTVTIAPKPATPTASARVCGADVNLAVSNPDPSANYFWYDAPAVTNAIATGATAQTTIITANKTYYVGSGTRGSVGITSKNNFPSAGDYQANGGNYMKYTAQVPVILESVRLFTKFPGTVTIIAADISNVNGTSYSYTTLASQTINVFSTNPNPVAGGVAATPADLADTGAIFQINLPLPAGSHAIIVLATNATIFRNNNITGNPYPFTISNVFSLTGNPATSATDPNFFQNFYYYLYDLKIKTADCISDRVAVVATTGGPAPVITQAGDSLVSNTTTGNQWYLNDVMIPGAVNKSYKPIQSGLYTVRVSDGLGCNTASNAINYSVTATVDLNGTAIGLTVSPNPSAGLFNLLFDVKTKDDLRIEVLNNVGQQVYAKVYPGFIGRFSDQLNIGQVPPGVYILNIQHNNKWYIKKLLVNR